VDVLPDGTRCRIRGKEMACPDVTNYVRDTLKLKPGSPVGFVSIGELHEESIQALRASLAAAGYTIKSTMK
jgi:outer membrane protein TolC